jgi:Fe-S oxidoreductase
MIEYKRKEIADPGIDKNAEKLTPEKIEKTINAVLKGTGARLKAYLDTCIHCALCSEACHYYLSHGKDPTYSPVAKVKMTLWEMVKKKGKVDAEFIKRASRIAYTECNRCRRCSLYCPYGIDIWYLMALVRRICFLLKVVPQFQMDTVNSHASTYNMMWLKQDDWVDTVQWQEEEVRMEYPTARIPFDKEGAEVMYTPIAPEPKFKPQLLAATAKIFHAAGIDWTMPSFDGWDNSDISMHAADFENMARVERKHFEAALKLKVKRIIMCE